MDITTAANTRLRNDDDGQQDMLVWPACRARVTWPRLSTVWDTFGTEPETPSRQEKPAVIKACEGWMQACMAPVSMDMPQRTGRLNLQGRKSYFNLPLQRQASVINTSRHMSRRDLFAPSDCGSVAASIKSQPSGKLVAAKLTYTREGPVTLEIVKEVASLELDLDTESPSRDLFDLIRLRAFDEFLVASLLYMDAFLRLRDVKERVEEAGHGSFFAEVSGANSGLTQEQRRIEKEMVEQQAQLSTHYCRMLLPETSLQLKRFHHSYSGSWRTSRTNADQMLQEGILRYATAVVWIALGRKHWDLITEELGRLFRSSEFNINSRQVHKPTEREIQAEYQQQKRYILNGGSLSNYTKQRDLAPEKIPHLQSVMRKNSPLVSMLLDQRRSRGKQIDTSWGCKNLEMRPHVGILGRPVQDYTPFLEPKPVEVKKAKHRNGDNDSDGGSDTNSETTDDRSDSIAGSDFGSSAILLGTTGSLAPIDNPS
ncbi:protein phosphatase 1 regulatory subunit 36-like isoform X2 [Sycon ciliatum]|uniref:protein phosphatase 1 regulatory subunit 36-like isoform X2 n=1 Tax=Sycon ciliatum TaxID=27933 RepID=UPI0031F71D4E